MTAPLALWHSTAGNEARFAALIEALAPGIPVRHRTRPELLAAAQPELTPEVRRRVAIDILELVDQGAGAVLCTCSTLGPGAESAAELTSVPVLRVDRPMIEAALDRGPRITVAAALASTLGPTGDLLRRVARERGVVPEIREIVCEGAWTYQERGDAQGYSRAIAAAIRRALGPADAVVLAQASMAGAVELLADLGVPVLASPPLGVAAAVAAWRRAVAGGGA
jgi:Asp/Glu/hydantoin racemase